MWGKLKWLFIMWYLNEPLPMALNCIFRNLTEASTEAAMQNKKYKTRTNVRKAGNVFSLNYQRTAYHMMCTWKRFKATKRIWKYVYIDASENEPNMECQRQKKPRLLFTDWMKTNEYEWIIASSMFFFPSTVFRVKLAFFQFFNFHLGSRFDISCDIVIVINTLIKICVTWQLKLFNFEFSNQNATNESYFHSLPSIADITDAVLINPYQRFTLRWREKFPLIVLPFNSFNVLYWC